MATLEKIRQQKKWLAIVIGAALVAFIIEVGIEAIGRSVGNSAAAKVGNEKIDIMAFQRRVEQEAANDQENNQQMDAATRQQQVLDEMIAEKLLEKEYDALGITVSDWEISQLMIGKNPAPAVAQFAQQAGAKSPAELYDFIMNPGKQGVSEAQVAELRKQWDKLTEDIVKQFKFAKLQNLLAGCIQPNDLDLAQMKEDEAVTNVITFAKKDYSTLSDDKYPVTDEELKAKWQEMKPWFKTDEDLRLVHFIAVNIEPSAEDITAANKVADAAYIALQKGRGVDSVRLLGTVKIDTAKVTQKELPAKVRDYFVSAEVGTTRRDSVVNNHHEMYKLINKQQSLDSIDLAYVVVQGDAKIQKDVLAQLNSGKSIDDVKKAYPQKVDGKASEWQRVFNAPDSMINKIANATLGTYFVFNSGEQGATLMKVNERKPAKMFYTLATISYDAYASTKTSEQLRDKFQDFLNKNKTVKDFEENAAKAGFNAVEALISPSTPQLGQSQFGGGIKDSRKAIKWAFDNKKGDVSPIFSDNNDVLLAVAVDDVFEEGYVPYTYGPAKDMLAVRIRSSKKGDDLMKQYQGKANDLNGYAAVMGEKIDTVNIVFSANGDPKLGNEPGLIGRMATAQPGKLIGPWKGNNALFVYQVVKQEKEQREPTKEELQNRYEQSRGSRIFANQRTIQNILTKATKVKKRLIDFY